VCVRAKNPLSRKEQRGALNRFYRARDFGFYIAQSHIEIDCA
jgi:hypothetical protein